MESGDSHRQQLFHASQDEQHQQQQQAAKGGDFQTKRVPIQKDPGKPLGFTITKNGDTLVISRVVCGGVCEKTGFLREGDELISVNGIELEGRELDEVCDHMETLSGQLTVIVRRSVDAKAPAQDTGNLVLKALFSYNPSKDSLRPCKELILAFSRGDVIHVVSRADSNWWQGYKDGDEDSDLARIFPSPEFRKNCYDSSRFWYERQAPLSPDPLRRRPLVLVGPPGVGHHELRVRLIETDPNRFAPAVPHTTRRPRPEEKDGVDYWFVGRPDFQRLQSGGAFIETGQFDGDLYGTSVDSVRKVVDDGKVCVLTLQPEALKRLRTHPSRLMPYAVFVSPPSTDKLRALKQELSAFWDPPTRSDFTDNELVTSVERGKKISFYSGHLFDLFLEHTSLAAAHMQLVELASQLQNPEFRQWVPASWVQDEPLILDQLTDMEF